MKRVAGGGARGQTLTLRNFAGGLDRRDGIFTEDQNRFRELVNCRISNRKRLVRRPPLKKAGGVIDDATTQGLFEIKGELYTVAKKAASVTNTLTGATVSVLRFDNPDYCTTWELLGGEVMNGVLCALIRHTFPGTTVTSKIFLHVFDAKRDKPTYVEDPYCPTSWSPNLPLHVYRQGAAGSFHDYTPRIAVAGGRLFISRPDGNVGFCRTGNPRSWNTRTVDQLVAGGEWWYFHVPASGGPTFTYVVSEDHASLTLDGKWGAYVLEYLDSTGTWRRFTEDSVTPTTDKHYETTAVATRFSGASYTNEIKLNVYWTGAADAVLRFRAIAGPPPITITRGCVAAWYDQEVWTGDGVTVAFQSERYGQVANTFTGVSLSTFKVYVNGVLKADPADYVASWALPSGAQRNTLKITFGSAPALGARIEVILPNAVIYDGTLPLKNVSVAAASNTLTAGVATFEGQAVTCYLQYAGGPSGLSSTADILVAIGLGLYFSDPTEADNHLDGVAAWDLSAGAFPAGSGLQRYRSLLTTLKRMQHSASYSAPLEVTDYTYGSKAGSESAWFLDRKLSYEIDVAGFDDAGFIPTVAAAVASQAVTALAAIKDRLVVFYKSGTEVWYVPPDVLSHVLNDSGRIGTGPQTSPAPILMFGTVLCGMARSIRGVSLSSGVVPSIASAQERDENIGEPILDLGVPLQQAACYWSWLGEYVTAVSIDGDFQFLVLDFSTESKITAWGTWTAAGVAAVDTFAMVAVDERLYFRSGENIYYFDASAVPGTPGAFRDSNDPASPADAYESKAAWLYNDFGAPGKTKNLIGMDLIQTGRATLAHRFVAHDESVETDPIPVTDTTVAKGYIPCAVWGTGIAPVIRSVDDSGYELQELSMRFLVRMR